MVKSYRASITYLCAGLAVGLVVACAAPSAPAGTPTPGPRAQLYTRTPVPAATAVPTPTVHPQVFYQQALGERMTWDLEHALAGFNRALEAAPDARVYASRAEVYRLRGQYEQAGADIESALALDPELADAWRQQALLSYAQERWEEALGAVDKLIELEPGDGSARVLRAKIYVDGFGQFRPALADYERAIDIDPVFDKATQVERWHILAELGQWEEAVLISHKIMNDDPLRYFYRGWALIKLGRLDEAIQKLSFGIERYPDYPVMLYYALGVAYFERQAWFEAVQALEVALQQWGAPIAENTRERPVQMTTADILGPLGISYMELRQCETGAAILERAIAESPNPDQWISARQRVEDCYLGLTPTPTATPWSTSAP